MARQGVKPLRHRVVEVAAMLSACLAPALVCVRAPRANEHEIATRSAQWVPVVLFVAPGDSVVFRGMSGHETELMEGLAPDGAGHWRSELDAEGFTVTLDEPGAYIYKCQVHMNAGMVGAIVVGDGAPQNLDEIKAALGDVETGRLFVERVVGRLERQLRRRGFRRRPPAEG